MLIPNKFNGYLAGRRTCFEGGGGGGGGGAASGPAADAEGPSPSIAADAQAAQASFGSLAADSGPSGMGWSEPDAVNALRAILNSQSYAPVPYGLQDNSRQAYQPVYQSQYRGYTPTVMPQPTQIAAPQQSPFGIFTNPFTGQSSEVPMYRSGGIASLLR